LEIREEIRGIHDGCKKCNPKTRVDLEHLVVLNTGIDIICSMVYTGNFLKRGIPGLEPEDFDIPLMCNAFTICGKSAGGGFYFGRDFTFPTSDVFQDTAAPIIYNPVALPGTHGISSGYGMNEDLRQRQFCIKYFWKAQGHTVCKHSRPGDGRKHRRHEPGRYCGWRKHVSRL
jgi:hypothetical protein